MYYLPLIIILRCCMCGKFMGIKLPRGAPGGISHTFCRPCLYEYKLLNGLTDKNGDKMTTGLMIVIAFIAITILENMGVV